MRIEKTPYIFIIPMMAVIAMGTFLCALNVSAQEHQGWSAPQRINGLGDFVLAPYLVADDNRTVHAFVSDWVGSNQQQLAIMYLKWTMESGWTTPVDIILPRLGQARVKGAFLDHKGMIHLAYFEGDDRSASIYHASSYTTDAGNAHAWSLPQRIGPMALTPEEAIITGNDYGNLIIAYFGNLIGRGLYVNHSPDNGITWLEPTSIYFTESDERWIHSLNASVDNHNQVHLVWTIRTTNRNENEIVYYAKMDIENITWSDPIILSELLAGDLAYSAAIIDYKGELFAIYHYDNPTTRWMRRSQDGGINWSEPVRLFDHIGSNGAASLVIDSNDDLHMFFGNRIGWPSIHGLWHSKWQGNHWSMPLAIISGPPAPNFDPGRQQAVVSQGNVIMVNWIQELGRPERNGVWYSYQVLNAPERPISVLPTPEPTPFPTLVSVPLKPNQSPTDFPVLIDPEENINNHQRNSAEPIFVTTIFTILIVFSVIVTQHHISSNKRK
jgi:hypothetical protein